MLSFRSFVWGPIRRSRRAVDETWWEARTWFRGFWFGPMGGFLLCEGREIIECLAVWKSHGCLYKREIHVLYAYNIRSVNGLSRWRFEGS